MDWTNLNVESLSNLGDENWAQFLSDSTGVVYMTYEVVKTMNANKPIVQGNCVVALPGGKSSVDFASANTDSGVYHSLPPATGLVMTQAQASGANTNFGVSGSVAAYPQFYQGGVPVGRS